MWIMKPVGSSRGRGISILNDISGVSYGEAMVIQRYVAQPLLLDGFKFDLRRYNPLASPYQPLTITLPSPYHYLTITLPPLRFDLRLYVLVTSFNPLEAYLYTEGFGRFTNEPYSLDAASLQNLYVHLTNASIQKDHPSMAAHAEQAEQAEQAAQAEQAGQTAPPKGLYGGSKSSLAQLRQRLEAAGVDYSHMWARVTELVLRTLLAVHAAIPLLTTYYSPLTTHYSPLTTHHSPLTPHRSPLTATLTAHHSPLTTHRSPLTATLTSQSLDSNAALGNIDLGYKYHWCASTYSHREFYCPGQLLHSRSYPTLTNSLEYSRELVCYDHLGSVTTYDCLQLTR